MNQLPSVKDNNPLQEENNLVEYGDQEIIVQIENNQMHEENEDR